MLRGDVLKNSRWLRDHTIGRGNLFHPLNHAQGPSQAKHVPNIRISSFYKKVNESYDILIDNWKESAGELPKSLHKVPGWTAFVYQVPHSLLEKDQ